MDNFVRLFASSRHLALRFEWIAATNVRNHVPISFAKMDSRKSLTYLRAMCGRVHVKRTIAEMVAKFSFADPGEINGLSN